LPASELGRFLSNLLDFREFYVDKPMKVFYRFQTRVREPGLGRANTGIKISDLKRQGVSLAFLLAENWRVMSINRQAPSPYHAPAA
jgi:hypothetical protein